MKRMAFGPNVDDQPERVKHGWLYVPLNRSIPSRKLGLIPITLRGLRKKKQKDEARSSPSGLRAIDYAGYEAGRDLGTWLIFFWGGLETSKKQKQNK